MVKEKKPVKRTYKAKVGCWNCDTTYEITVKKGEIVMQHLFERGGVCKECGCDTLKMYKEYQTERKILKDLMLHNRIENPPQEGDEDRRTHDHFK